MKKILITGANGFVGSHLVDFCITKKCEIFAIEKPNQIYTNLYQYTRGKLSFSNEEKLQFLGKLILIPTDRKSLTILECDIKNGNLLENILREVKPDYLFHFAAQPYIIPSWEDPIDTFETNVLGTINIFEPIKQYNIKTRVVLACTSAEYGTSSKLNRPLKETDPLLALHPYGISKIAAELLARQYYLNFEIETINLRLFNQTGIRRTNDAASDFIRKVAQIELGQTGPVIEVGNISPYRDFTDIKDTIQAIWLAATNGKPGETYNVCSNRKIQIRELLNIILSFSEKNIEVIENTSQKLRKLEEDTIIGDNSKIKSELGWSPMISLESTLKEMFEYWLDYYSKKSNN